MPLPINTKSMRPLQSSKIRLSPIKRKRQEFNVSEIPLTPKEPKAFTKFFDLSLSCTSLLGKKEKVQNLFQSLEISLNNETMKKNRTMKDLAKDTSFQKLKLPDINRNRDEMNHQGFKKIKQKEELKNSIEFQTFLKENFGALLILYLREEVIKYYYQNLQNTSIKSQLNEPQVLEEQTEKCLIKSSFDPYRQQQPSQIDLFMDYVDLQVSIRKHEQKLKSIYKTDPVRAMTFFFAFEKEKNVFSKKLFSYEMFGGEKKLHVSRFNLLKVEIFWIKILEKGGRKEFLKWLSSIEHN